MLLTVHYITLEELIIIMSIFVIVFIVGYIFIRRHLKNEKEKEQVINDIHKIGKI